MIFTEPTYQTNQTIKTTSLLLVSTTALFLASCENPADQTTGAVVTEAVEVSAASASDGVKYTFTGNSEIHFTGSKVTGSHTGGFKSFSGGFTVENNALAGTGQKIVIEMDSLWSDNEKLTGHLKSPDFFNVDKFPDSSFELTGLKSVSEGGFEVSGNLTLVGVTKNITFPATASLTGSKVGIHAKFDINRKDFGIVYAGMADDLIRDEVVIELKLEAAPQA